MRAGLLHFPTATPAAVATAWPWANSHHHAPACTAKAMRATHRTRVFCSALPLGHDNSSSNSSAAPGAAGLDSSSPNRAAEEQLLAIGHQHTLEGNLDSALRQFELAASQAPRSAVCKAELGRALVRLGRSADGFNCLVTAFGIDSLCPGVKDGFREYYRAEIEASLPHALLRLCFEGHPNFVGPPDPNMCTKYEVCLFSAISFV